MGAHAVHHLGRGPEVVGRVAQPFDLVRAEPLGHPRVLAQHVGQVRREVAASRQAS